MTIRKIGPKKWRLYSKSSGRNLGTYPTKEGAIKRERQVQFFKRYKGKSGWHNEGARHSLARKGIRTKSCVLLDIDRGKARVLTQEKKVIDIPVSSLPKTKKYMMRKLKPVVSNKNADPEGEWQLKDNPELGTGTVSEWKNIFGDVKV